MTKTTARAGHMYEAVFTKETVRCEFGEDFVSRFHTDVFAARFSARGDGTANSTAAAIAGSLTSSGRGHMTWNIWRVVNGVRSATDTRQDAIARARRFGGRRY